MRREVLIPLVVCAVLAGAAGAAYWGWQRWSDRAESEADADAEAERDDGEARKEAGAWARKLGEESAELMPEAVEGAALGMTKQELVEARPAASPSSRGHDDPTKSWMEEPLEGGAKALYGFEPVSKRLVRIQVMSRLPKVDAIKPHLTAMNERYGTPTGVWRCPNTGGVPTLRFTWRRNVTAIADILLIHTGGISLTYDIAPSETIGNSLRKADCRPTSPEDLEKFPPVATPEQLEGGSSGAE